MTTLNISSSGCDLVRVPKDVWHLVNEVRTEPKTRSDMPKTSYSKPMVGSTGMTGSWRTFDPVIDHSKCSKCRTCWLHCPEATITVDEDGTPHIDLDFCKGCGICAQVCPKKCIEMVRTGGKREEQT
jgi:pyruvate ferredoxin oxidoreductase delta subunit